MDAKSNQGKTALITGGGQGVGQGIALALAKTGAQIVITGRTQAKLDATCNEIEKLGGQALGVVADVLSAEDIEKSVSQTVAQFGGVDILVNNAQSVANGPLLDLDEAALQAGWESGPLASFRLMKLCHPYLKNGGHIINVLSSVMKRWDMAGFGGYAAAKAAMQQLTRAAACEWGVDGIRVNAIMPHADSPALQWWARENPEQAEAFARNIPLRRIGSCEADIGRFVALMCHPDSAYLTGQTIALDGGQVYIG
jgi:meso-butanediol dehydrogenase/(S,S)-butanediol dehydrogenase/diacetyl reductase